MPAHMESLSGADKSNDEVFHVCDSSALNDRHSTACSECSNIFSHDWLNSEHTERWLAIHSLKRWQLLLWLSSYLGSQKRKTFPAWCVLLLRHVLVWWFVSGLLKYYQILSEHNKVRLARGNSSVQDRFFTKLRLTHYFLQVLLLPTSLDQENCTFTLKMSSATSSSLPAVGELSP